MSSISNERLQEFTDLINQRLKEFDSPHMPRLSAGIVRVAHDVIKQWYEEREEGWAMQRISEVTITAEMAMKLSQQGYERGVAAAQRNKHDQAFDFPEGEPPATNGFTRIPEAEPTPEPDPHPLRSGQADDPYGIRGMFSEKPDAPPIAPSQAPIGVISPTVAATLGPEHTMVTPLKVAGRTLAEVDADLSGLKLDSEEKADQLRAIIGELQMISQGGEMPTMAEWDKRKPENLPKAQTLLSRYRLSWGRLAEYANLKYEGRGLASI